MNIRYQVFVSSTYADLKNERAKVIQTIMELDCIPAGMELFPAIDEEQFNFIKKIIDDCDYYIVIIGGKYGSLSEDGISYTEKEYDYAIIKGIKVLAFIHSNPNIIPLGKSETEQHLRDKLEAFKQKVSTNRLVKFWDHTEELPGLVALSLSKTIKTYPAVGWLRANTVTNPEIIQDLNTQLIINRELTEKVQELKFQVVKPSIDGLAELDDKIVIKGSYTSGSGIANWEVKITWKEIFAILSPHLLEHPADGVVKTKLSSLLFNFSDKTGYSPNLNDDIFQTIKIQFQTLGLINLKYQKTTKGGMALFWSLTEVGQFKMIELKTVKK